MYKDAKGRVVLEGDGTSYKFKLAVDGPNLVVDSARATWFGGPDDEDDDGETASGIVNTRQNPDYIGLSLPMYEVSKACHGSPIPKLPWGTHVRITNIATGVSVIATLVDVGPSAPPLAQGDIDLCPKTMQTIHNGSMDNLQVSWEIPNGFHLLPTELQQEISAFRLNN